jgi:predicted HicB family RNase H-like nuclease
MTKSIPIQNRPPPKVATVQCNIRIRPSLKKEAVAFCKANGISLSSLIKALISKELKRKGMSL